MRVSELKSEFHKLIDNINDEKVLINLYEAILDYSNQDKNVDIVDELSDEQKVRLKDSIDQVRNGKTMRHDNVKVEISKWNMK